MPEPEFPHLREPLAIGSCLVPNRLLRTAHATNMAGQGNFTSRLTAYHEERAAGGFGLTILEGALVHPQCSLGFPAWLGVFADDFMPSFRRAADRLRPYGMRLIQQLNHPGSRGPSTDGTPSWSSSNTPDPHSGRVPVPMTTAMIDEAVSAFAAAARRCQAAGLDGVEIHGAHGYLCHQFLSPVFNRRTDEYGGSLENRMRFLAEVLAACRASVADGFPVGVRLSSEDFAPGGGMGPVESAEVAATLEARGLVDFVDISVSSGHDRSKAIGPMFEPEGYELGTSLEVAAAVSVPTMVTGRILGLEQAEEIVAAGVASMVSMVRASIADPDVVRLGLAGEAAAVRPCVGCNQGCVGFLDRGLAVGCAVNARAGRETSLPAVERAASPGRCVVVGGGVAGMEAARVAALGGHRVTLFEAEPALGGQLKDAAAASARSGLLPFLGWLEAELSRLGVDVRRGRRATAAEVRDERPDLAIVATGSERVADGCQRRRPLLEVEGVKRDHVVNSIEALRGGRPLPRRALVFDDRWDIEAISVAETLLDRGAEVAFATSAATLAPLCEATLHRQRYLTRLTSDSHFALHLSQELTAISDSHATLRGINDGRAADVDADLVVLVGRPVERRELAAELRAAGVPSTVVGDAQEATDFLHAVHGAYRAVHEFNERS